MASPSKIRIGYYQKNINLGGVGKYILNLAEGLDPKRYEILVYMDPIAGTEDQYFAERIKALGAEPHFLDKQGAPDLRSAQLPPAGERGIIPASKSSRKNFISKLVPQFLKDWVYQKRTLLRIQKAFERERLDVLHLNLGYFPSLPHIMAAASRLRCVKILTVHSMGNEDFRKRISPSVMTAFDCVIAVNEKIKTKLVENYRFLNSKIRVIYNGINPPAAKDDVQAKRKPLGAGNGEKLILFPARLDALKGHETLFEALKLINSRISYKIFLAGDGFNRESLENLAAKHIEDGRVIFGGYRPDMDMLYQACDWVMLPSLLEGFPFTVLEAMAAGKPVLATDVGEVRKMIGEAGAGILVPPGDAAALAKAMEKMLGEGDSELKKRGEAGMKQVRELYPADKMLAETYACYGNPKHSS